MMVIPAELVALITFPGVILHEVAHRFFCDIFQVRVYAVNYFSCNRQAGYVALEIKDIKNESQSFLISCAPLFINGLVGIILTFPYMLTIMPGLEESLEPTNPIIYVIWKIVLWIGCCCLFCSIPSDNDLDNIDSDKLPLVQSFLYFVLTTFCCLANMPYIGWCIKVLYSYGLAYIFPLIYWYGICI